MSKSCVTIYKKARLKAGLTQEQAAEFLGCSVRTLSAYGNGTPPGDIVCRMCDFYNAPWLAYMYLQSSNPVGQKYLPKIDVSNLPSTVLRFQKEMTDASNVSTEMVEVTCDGVIDGDEKEVGLLLPKR